jgi:hypothetical protein
MQEPTALPPAAALPPPPPASFAHQAPALLALASQAQSRFAACAGVRDPLFPDPCGGCMAEQDLEPPALPRLWDLTELRAAQAQAPWTVPLRDLLLHAEAVVEQGAAGRAPRMRGGGGAGRCGGQAAETQDAAELLVGDTSDFLITSSVLATDHAAAHAVAAPETPPLVALLQVSVGRQLRQWSVGGTGLGQQALGPVTVPDAAAEEEPALKPDDPVPAKADESDDKQKISKAASQQLADSETAPAPDHSGKQAPRSKHHAHQQPFVSAAEPLEVPVPLLSYAGPTLHQNVIDQLLPHLSTPLLLAPVSCEQRPGTGPPPDITSQGSGGPPPPVAGSSIRWCDPECAAVEAGGGSCLPSLDELLLAESNPKGAALGGADADAAVPPELRDLPVECFDDPAAGDDLAGGRLWPGKLQQGRRGGVAQSAGAEWKEMLSACGLLRRQPLGHLELYFDWSLLQPAAPQGAASLQRLVQQLPAALAGGTAAASANVRQKRQLQAVLRQAVRRVTLADAGCQPRQLQELTVAAGKAGGQQSAAADQRTGGTKRAAAEQLQNDMAFFTRVGAATSGGAAASGRAKRAAVAAVHGSASASAVVAQAAGAVVMVPAAAAPPPPPPSQTVAAIKPEADKTVDDPASPHHCQRTPVPCPDGAPQLLQLLQSDRLALLRSMEGAGSEADSAVASCALWDAGPAEKPLGALGGSGGSSAGDKQRAQQLVALTLIAQTAAALLDSGVRVAHLFMRHMLQQLPSVAPLLAQSAGRLEASHARTERLDGEDHPKQSAFQRLLSEARSRNPVSVESCN